jgi:hypothetical protein
MNIWDDHVQYQMLLDALNLNNNSLASLSYEYYRSCFPTYTFYSYNGVDGVNPPTEDRNLFDANNSNFLLGFPVAADSSHMEELSRTSPDVNWTTHGSAKTNPFGAGAIAATLVNGTLATHCVFSAIYD